MAPSVTEQVVRHYRGSSREAAQAAYREDAAQAYRAGYVPVAHRWSEDWSGHTLSVAYRPEGNGDAPENRGEALESNLDTPPAVPPVTTLAAPEQADQQVVLHDRQPPTHDDQPPAHNGQPYGPDSQPSALDSQPLADAAPATAPGAQQTEQAQGPQQPQQAQAAQRPNEKGDADTGPTGTGPALRRARLTVQTLDMHCAGEPLRIVRSGFPAVPDGPILERRRWVRENADHIRRAIVHEPRGHRDMYGAILLPPHASGADVCLLFMHNEGYSTMCGHGVIAVTVGLIEEELYPAQEPETTIRYEVPAGLVVASATTHRADDGGWRVEGVRFTNVPAYLHARTLAISPEGVELHGRAGETGQLSVDLAFGGAYYGIVDAAELGLRVVPEQAEALRRAGAAITDVLRRDHTPSHPLEDDLGFVYGTIIVDRDPPSSPDGRATTAHLRNATIFADAELDRSPCGSGTSALLAQLHARGHLRPGHEIANAGITGEVFLGRVESETMLGNYPAVVTSIAGTAYVVGYSTLLVDERDPLGEGFVLR